LVVKLKLSNNKTPCQPSINIIKNLDKISCKGSSLLEKNELILANSSILLVEDDVNLAQSFAKVLLLYVQKVYTANNGQEAYELYQAKHPDIIITDVKMPKMNGLELIKLIRSHDQDIPIIVTSAYTDKDFLLESIKLSLVEYVVKPIKESDLLRLLEISATKLLEKSKTPLQIDENSRYDYANKMLIQNDKLIALTTNEIEFLELLFAHKGNLVTRQNIEEKLYDHDEIPPSALKNLVFKLRKKMPIDIITTVGKLGYMVE
jgi:DNA-binding response OmpR family regulator